MKRRDELSNNNKPTEYFNELEKNGNKASEIEYTARTFYGRVNILMKQKNLTYKQIIHISGLNESMLPKYMTRPFTADPKNPNKWVKNQKHRNPNLGIVLAFAISLQLNIDEFNALLDSADLAPLKEWRFFRGDDIILKHYNEIINEISEHLKNDPNPEDEFYLMGVDDINYEFAARGLPLLGIGKQYSKDPTDYEADYEE